MAAYSDLLLSALCLGNQPHSQKEPGLLPVALLCGHLSLGPPATVHMELISAEIFEKLKSNFNNKAECVPWI